MHVEFRNSETPCFYPAQTLQSMSDAGKALIQQLTSDPQYREASKASIPPEYNVPNETPHPLFIQADFGLDANLKPKLVEIQGFPSIYAYQPVLAQTYLDVYEVSDLGFLLTPRDYW